MEKAECQLRASEVLDDALAGAMRWAYGPIEEGADSRVVYVGTLALLRAVGHVLHKVDCQRFPQLKEEVGHRFGRWKKGEGYDVIFPEFIEEERNSILKEYTSLWDSKNEREFKFRTYTNPSVDEGGSLSGDLLHETTFNAIVVPNGALAGYFVDELLFAAIRWWGRELTELEHILKATQ